MELNGFDGIDGLGLGVAADTTGDVAHLTATTLGAYAPDTLFDTGFTVTASQQLVVLGLAQGATVVMQPNLGDCWLRAISTWNRTARWTSMTAT